METNYKIADGKFCPHCGKPLYFETDPELDYPYVCLDCDENFYEVEVVEKKKCAISNIDWDCDDKDVQLPSETEIEVEIIAPEHIGDIIYAICEVLENKYEYCINSFVLDGELCTSTRII